ncbi:MAG: ABC transporter permease [Chloroflexi bacterium]|jgi:ABC-2 type transport system permease protein|nr:ABC transporter permease [Chloroflexota bacterium]MBT7081467.1 ABC transporter permease [Chloroflexota bacterium]MBT7289748.1 ABC transporter permease [Chloroflexota bacterium]
MRFLALAQRNFKEMFLDYLSLGLAMGLPIALLLILSPISKVEVMFSPANLAPGITLFAFVMLQFSSSMILAKDRDSALLSRLLTAPLKPKDFISAYSLPYIPVAIIQTALIFGIAALLGLETSGNLGLVFLVLFIMSLGYIGLGMVAGSRLTYKQVPYAYTAVLLLTIFGGAWFDLEVFGSGFQSVMNLLPFAHALDATRDVMVQGAGFSDVAVDFYWVMGYTIVFFALGIFLFRRKMVE